MQGQIRKGKKLKTIRNIYPGQLLSNKLNLFLKVKILV